MVLDVLQDMIAADRADGRQPFFVVGSAGTVNTGAVDDLAGIAAIAAAQDLWFHVDAAYGGFFMLTDRGREVLTGIELSDSMSLDPHKSLFIPYGTGSLLVRERGTLSRAHAIEADYLPTMRDDPDFVDFSEISPELSRGHRGLRIWLPLKMHGAGAFRRIFISHSVVGGNYLLRVCVLSFRTHMPNMEIALEDIRAVADELTAS